MGDHPLFCVCPFRGGIGRGMPSCAGGADPYYVETISLHTDADPHHEDFISLIYDCARQGHTSPIVASFLPSPPKEETKQRRKGAARSLRPGSLAGRYLRLTRSLRSLRQALRLDATGQTSSLRAPGSVQTGGEAAPILGLGRTFFECASPLVPYRLIKVQTHIRRKRFFIVCGSAVLLEVIRA